MFFTRKVRNTFKQLSIIDNINYWWCLIAAYAVYQTLWKPKWLNIIQLSNSPVDKWMYNNICFINWTIKKAKSWSHFWLTYDNWKTYIDTNGTEIKTSTRLKTFVIPEDKLEQFFKSAIKHWDWNSFFDRKEQVPKIEKLLSITLPKYII